VKVTDNHFVSDFFHLKDELSCFEIAAELSFQDRERGFNELSFSVSGFVAPENHFRSASTADSLIIPETDRDDRISMEVFSDETMDHIRVVSSVHNITLRCSHGVTLSEQFPGMAGIWTRLFEAMNLVMTWCPVSTEIEVFRKCFRILPVRSEK
jgi:hypothetical protein